MEDEIQACKFPRLGNVVNNLNNSNLGSGRRKNDGGIIGSDFQRWQERQREEENSSRIVRVSRGSGGKDRHSKVMTSKGLRDRRVRLSVSTAIQFYDLQDRLGYDQPSKAVDWLIKAASDSISELPSLNNAFAQIDVKSDEKTREQEFEFDERQNKNLCLSKSACSSTSETSKENETSIAQQQQHHQNMSQTASFTELLTGGIGSSNGSVHNNQIHQGGFSGHSPFGSENENQSDMIQLQHFPFMSEQHLMQQPSVVNSSSSSSSHHDNYNLNFTISSSGLVGYNRGTLQSNSLLPHFQRFSAMDHGSSTTSSSSSNNLPSFFTGAPVPHPPVAAAATPSMDQQLHFSPLFDARLQLFYRDGSQHSDQKDKCNKN